MFIRRVIGFFSIYCAMGAYSYEKLDNIDFYGGDMYPIYGVNESINCMNLCEKIRDCVAVTYCDNTCYIKDKKMEGVMKESCITFDMYPESDIWSSNDGSNAGSTDGENIEEIVVPVTTMPVSTEAPTNAPTDAPIEIGTPAPTNTVSHAIQLTPITAIATAIATSLFFL